MLVTIFKDSAKYFTLGQALEYMEYGIFIAVNDGKDLTVIIEEVK